MEKKIEYTLKLSSAQAVETMKALELLFRLKINQPNEISRAVLDGMYERIGCDEYCRRRDKANEYLRLAFLEIFPDWKEAQKDDEWYTLYNIYQAIRYQRHLAEYPDSNGVDSYPPRNFGSVEPVPECTYKADETEKQTGQSKGEWIHKPRIKSQIFECSVCGGAAYYPQPNNQRKDNPYLNRPKIMYQYCPNCGHAMNMLP